MQPTERRLVTIGAFHLPHRQYRTAVVARPDYLRQCSRSDFLVAREPGHALSSFKGAFPFSISGHQLPHGGGFVKTNPVFTAPPPEELEPADAPPLKIKLVPLH